MSQKSFQDIIRKQDEENNRLRQSQKRVPQSDIQNKYRKALKEIAGIINANKQLKRQLQSLKYNRGNELENYSRAQSEQYTKAYEKILKEKNEIMIAKQNLNLENQKLKSTVEHLQHYIQDLKSQLKSLQMQKQSLEKAGKNKGNIDKGQKIHIDKQQLAYLKQREEDFKKFLENYQRHNQKMISDKIKLEDEIDQLRSRLQKTELRWTSDLNLKEQELYEARDQVKKQYVLQINAMKTENSHLRNKLNEYEIKIQTMQIATQYKSQNQPNQYDLELLYALRQVKSQIQPMKAEIASLQDQNQYEKEQNIRDRANLKMKVIQLESELQQVRDNSKSLENKLLQAHEKERMLDDQEKLIHRLEQQNRMLGGRIIVLQSKDVALRNRNGEQLEEKVLQFQTRVEMLLNQKQNLSNVKNVSIHQMIALKAYIMQLDSKLRSLMNENQYSMKKYRNYKEKYQGILKQITKYEDVFTSYKSKINAYEKLIQRLQNELQRALAQLQNAPQTINRTIVTEQSITSTQIFKRRYAAVKQKLQLQEKYAKQQLDTTKLNYQTKIMEISMQLQQLDNLKETIQLFKSKNQQLIEQSRRKDNEIIELRSNARERRDDLIQQESNRTIKQLRQQINSLNLQITQNEAAIFKSKVNLRQVEDQYKKRISALQRQLDSVREQLERKNRKTMFSSEVKSFEEVYQLNKYKKRVQDLEQELASEKEINLRAPFNEQYKTQAYIMEISSLKIDLEDTNRKLETLLNTKKRLENQLRQAQQQNQKLETINYQQQRQYKEKIQQYVLSIERKDEEYRSQSYQINSSNTEMNFKLMEQQANNQKLFMEYEALKVTNQRLEAQNQKNTERISNFTNQIEQFRYKNDLLNEQNERIQTNLTRMQYKKKEMQNKLKMKENQFNELQNQTFSMKARLQSIVMLQRKIGQCQSQMIEKDNKISKLSMDLNKLNKQNALIYDKDSQINQLTSELTKLKITFTSDNENFLAQISQLTQTNHQLQVKIKNFMISNNNKQDQIQDLNFRVNRYERQLSQYKNKCYEQESDLFETSNNLQRLNAELTKNIDKLKNAEMTISQYQSTIMKLKSDNSQLNVYRKQYDDIVEDNRNKQEYIRKLSTEIRSLHLKIETDDVEQKESIINRLRTQNSMMRADLTSQINQLENIIGDRDQQLHRLNIELSRERQGRVDIGNQHSQIEQNLNYAQAHLRQIQHELHEKQVQIAEFQRQKLQFRNQYNQLKQNLQDQAKKSQNLSNIIKTREGQLYQLRQVCQEYQNQCVEKDRTVGKLTYQLSFIKEQIQNYQLDINHKQQNINRLNTQITRLRQQNSANFENMSDKDQTMYQLNFQLNSWKSKYQYIESQLKIKQSSSSQLYQQNQKLHLQMGTYEQQKQSLEIMLAKLKNQTEILKSQLQRLTEQITLKNAEISKLNKDSYQKQFDIENTQREELWALQQEVTSMKYNLSSLQMQNKDKEQIIQRLRNDLRTARQQKPTTNLFFTQEDYMRLKQSNFTLQRQLSTLKGNLSDKQFQISQLQNKITFNAKLAKEEKTTYEEQISYMQKEIETYIVKERKMTEEINDGQVTTRKLEELKFGLKMYEQQIDRLTKIVDELQEQVEQLRMRLNYLMNQQDRITENLMTLTLSFAEIQSLRNLLIEKEKQLEKARENIRTLTRIDATQFQEKSVRVEQQERSFSRKAQSPVKNRTIVIQRIANISQGNVISERQQFRQESQRSRSLMQTSQSRQENIVQRSYSPQNFAFIPEEQRYGIHGYQQQIPRYQEQYVGYPTNVYSHIIPKNEGVFISQIQPESAIVRSSQITSQKLSGSNIISKGLVASPPHSMYQSGEGRF